MAIIRDSKFHNWIAQNDKYIEHLRLDYEKATGKEMEFDKYVEHFYYQSKESGDPLPSRAELIYMCWLADNRTLLNKAHTSMIEGEATPEAIRKFNYEMFLKTEQGEKELSQFIQ